MAALRSSVKVVAGPQRTLRLGRTLQARRRVAPIHLETATSHALGPQQRPRRSQATRAAEQEFGGAAAPQEPEGWWKVLLHVVERSLVRLAERLLRWGQSARLAALALEQLQQQQEAARGGAAGVLPAAAAQFSLLTHSARSAITQLRQQLTDDNQGMEPKMAALEHAAAGCAMPLFQAASAHQMAVRELADSGTPNPFSSAALWNHAATHACISEEERLREAVFAQVYAELLSGGDTPWAAST